MATVQRVLDVARGEIGYSRWTDPLKGSKYGRWYAELTGDSEFAENGVPYCAMFVSWVFAQADQDAPGLPGAYCPWIVSAGKNAGATVSTAQAIAGDIVLFDWDGDGVADHVGIVEANNGSYLTTVEGNTSDGNNSNGGMVQRRTRAYSTVICIIRPTYTGDDMTTEDIKRITDGIDSIGGRLNQIDARLADVLTKLAPQAPVVPFGGGMHRLVNTSTGAHTWTNSTERRDNLVKRGWTYERVAFELGQCGDGVYCLVHPANGEVMLTTSINEARNLANAGWQSEGIVGTTGEGAEVHRLYNKGNGYHVFTTDKNEISAVKSAGWNDEGVAFRAV